MHRGAHFSAAISRLCSFVLTFVLVAGLVPVAPAAAAGSGSISGIIHAENGTAVSAAGVRLYQERSGSWVWYDYVKSGSDGKYQFVSVPDGTYAVEFETTAYARECFDDVVTLGSATRLTVAGASTLAGKDATLSASGGFSGRVLGSDGLVLSGATVHAYRQTPTGAWEPLTAQDRTTDSMGNWAMISTLPGKYRIEISDPSGSNATRFIGGATTLETAADQICLPGSPNPLGTITLPAAGIVTGSVQHAYYIGGDFRVTAYSLQGSTWAPLTTVTCDGAGQYRLSLEPGTYRLRVRDMTGRYATGWFTSSGTLVTRVEDASNVTVTQSATTANGQAWVAVAKRAYGTLVNGSGTQLSGVHAVYEEYVYQPSLGRADWVPMRDATSTASGGWEIADLGYGYSMRVRFDPTAYNSANGTDLAGSTWLHPTAGREMVPFDSSGVARMDATLTPAPDTRAPVTSAVLDPNPWRWSSVSVTVTLSAVDPPDANGISRGVRETRYGTREDAGPLSAEQVYSGPIHVTRPGTTVVYFRSIDNADNEESPYDANRMKSASVYYDPNAPTTTALYSATNVNNALVVVGFSDPLSGWGSVWTRLDSGTWQQSQMVSTNVVGSHTLDFYGVDAVGNVEGTKSISFSVSTGAGDTTPPTTSITPLARVNGWVPSPSIDPTSAIVLSLTPSDPAPSSGIAETRFSMDGAPSQVYNTTDRVRVTEGTHTINYWSKDVAGNAGEPATETISFDGSYPEVTATVSASTADSATVTIRGTDPYSGTAKLYYNLDSAGLMTVEGSETVLHVSGYGTHTLSYFAQDRAGNGNPGYGPYSYKEFTVGYSDTVAPSSVASGVPGTWVSTPTTVTLSATDTAGPGEVVSGVTSIMYKLGSNVPQAYTAGIPVSSPGTTTIEYWAVDAAGNREATRTAVVNIDNVAPDTFGDSLMAPLAGSLVYPFTATDDRSGVAATFWRVAGGAWQTGNIATFSEPGLSTLEYYSVDYAGNAGFHWTPTFQILWPDITAPLVEPVVGPADGPNDWHWYDTVVNINATDPATNTAQYSSGLREVGWCINGSTEQTASYSPSVMATATGSTTITYRAADKAGRETTGSVTVKIDRTPPTISEGTAIFGDGFTDLPLTASDAVSGIDQVYWRYGADMASLGATQTGSTIHLTRVGTSYVEYWCVDRAGLSSGAYGRTMTVNSSDVVPPTTTISGVPASWSNAASVNVSFSAIDNGATPSGVASTHYRINDGADLTSPIPFTVTTDGTTKITYWSVDVRGNAETPMDAYVRLDHAAPITTSDAQTAYTSSAVINLNPQDGQSGVVATQWRLDGGSWSPGASASTSALGSHTLEFYSTDAVGNIEGVKSVVFTVSAPAPAPSPGPSPSPSPAPTPSPGPTPAPTPTAPASVNRMGGANRYDVALNLATTLKPSLAYGDVIVACGEDRATADPLGAAALAAAYECPVLLTPTAKTNAGTLAAIKQMCAANGGRINIHVVGGTSSVPAAVYNSYATAKGAGTIERINGANRYALAAQIAVRTRSVLASKGKSCPGVIVVNIENPASFNDALAASPISARAHMPLIGVRTAAVPGEAIAAMAQFGNVPRYALNGAYLPAGTRAAAGAGAVVANSPNREIAAVDIARWGVSKGFVTYRNVGLANKLSDALPAGAFIGQMDGVLLYSNAAPLSPTTAAFLPQIKSGVFTGWVFGGTATIAEGTRNQFYQALQ